MARLTPPEPNWEALVGGTQEAAWIADRDRKAALAMEMAGDILAVWEQLRERGAVYECSPQILAELPNSGDWYVSLAGLSLKTLGNLKEGPRKHGLRTTAKTFLQKVREGRATKGAQRAAFSNWVNDHIDYLHPEDSRSDLMALSVVSQILGGRVIGRGQNMGGEDAVVLVKGMLIEQLGAHGASVEVFIDGAWRPYRPEHNLLAQRQFRVNRRIVFQFLGGGDNPDIDITVDGHLVAVGEIKGRKDVSNVWESWMPQVADHMRTWSAEYPNAATLFFGTLINKEMVEGESARGTGRMGLRDLYREDRLSAAFNISKIVDEDAESVAYFEEFVASVLSLI